MLTRLLVVIHAHLMPAGGFFKLDERQTRKAESKKESGERSSRTNRFRAVRRVSAAQRRFLTFYTGNSPARNAATAARALRPIGSGSPWLIPHLCRSLSYLNKNALYRTKKCTRSLENGRRKRWNACVSKMPGASKNDTNLLIRKQVKKKFYAHSRTFWLKMKFSESFVAPISLSGFKDDLLHIVIIFRNHYFHCEKETSSNFTDIACQLVGPFNALIQIFSSLVIFHQRWSHYLNRFGGLNFEKFTPFFASSI